MMIDRKQGISHKPPKLISDLSSKTKRVVFLMFLGIAFVLSSSVTSAPDMKTSGIQNRERADSENVDFVGRWPYGACEGSAVDTARNIALIGNGYTLQVLDIANPTMLSKMGEIELDGLVQDIEISGSYAYVLTRKYLMIIDISDLTNLQIVGGLYFVDFDVRSLAVSSGIAFVAAGFNGLWIFDVSDPNNPDVLEWYNQNIHDIHDVAIWGNYAICDCVYSWLDEITAQWIHEEQVQVIDVSDPSAPFLAGTYLAEADYNIRGIDVSGDGYVVTCQYNETDETSKIVVIDVATDPTSPAEVGSCIESNSKFEGVTLSGNYAYILDSWGRLIAFDISNPLFPSSAGECEANGNFYGLGISGSFVGISHGGGGFSLYDVSNPASPSHLGNYETPYGVFGRHGTPIVVSGNYAYLAGMRVMDISDPSNPFLAGVGGADDANSVAISGRFAYCCGGWPRHFKIVDISSPTNPYQVASLGFPDNYQLFDVAVRENYAYVSGVIWISDGPYGYLRVVDISNPMNPHIVGSYDCPVRSFNSGGIALSGDYAYLVVEDWSLYSDLSATLRIIDISDPTDPREVGSYFRGFVETTTTGPDGTYSHTVSHNWSGTVIPSMDGYEFSPSHRQYDCVSSDLDNQDFTATVTSAYVNPQPTGVAPRSRYLFSQKTIATGSSRQDPPPTISGTVKTEGGAGIEGVTITFIDAYDYSSDVAVRGDYAYLAGGSFRIIDVSNPEDPEEIFSSDWTWAANNVALSGDYAYLGNLNIIDISDPFNPINLVNSSPQAYYSGEGGAGVAVSGNYVYVPGSLTILKNLLAPEISITNPTAWDTLNGSISIGAQASDSLGIDRVEFYIDDELRSTDFTSPYSYEWNTAFEAEGSHRIRARAYNNIRNRSSDSEIEVKVRNQCNLSIFYSSGGVTTPDTGTYSYSFGTEVPITAFPDNGYRFAGWTGDVPEGHENDNPLLITVDSDKSVTANFIQQCTLTLSAENGGTTVPVPGSHTYDMGTEVSITASPDSGYRFTRWTGDVPGGLENVVPLTIDVDSDKSITANFEAESPDEGETEKGKIDLPCFIATAAYGTPLHPHLDILRDFRDQYLMPSKFGRWLVECYYRYSPSAADFIAKHKTLQVVVRASLLPLVAFSYALLHLGPIIPAAMILSVFGLPVFLALVFRRKTKEAKA